MLPHSAASSFFALHCSETIPINSRVVPACYIGRAYIHSRHDRQKAITGIPEPGQLTLFLRASIQNLCPMLLLPKTRRLRECIRKAARTCFCAFPKLPTPHSTLYRSRDLERPFYTKITLMQSTSSDVLAVLSSAFTISAACQRPHDYYGSGVSATIWANLALHAWGGCQMTMCPSYSTEYRIVSYKWCGLVSIRMRTRLSEGLSDSQDLELWVVSICLGISWN
ncbi:hypothetical protein P280DRAFT_214239 [Massarina eburnea CBS 473.64]|uniref:Uncharacterized protein n=1 Tax=Massarina eburnea CBS 473.64 TaxID=1395130 RepID=A0A6A6SB64_9PLEO|nr:hypothetical protein P280DRAFT_214239 [Massarina eburnea CBS 473.64]